MTTTPRVLVLADPASWLELDEEDPPSSAEQPWLEVWDGDVSPGSAAGADPPYELIVAPPERPVAELREWRSRTPDTGLVVIAGGPDSDGRVVEFFGDDAVFFLQPPPNRVALRSSVREVLSFREASRSLADEGQNVPRLEESAPVSGWFELTAANHPVFLRRFRAWLEILAGLPLDAGERRRLFHAVREVGWNAIEWGNELDPSRKLSLSFLALENGILFRIQDEGQRHDWYGSREPIEDAAALQEQRSASGLRPGGLGLMLVERIVDRIKVSSNGNVVMLEKRFTPVGSS